MYCEHCGQKLGDNANFCANCGTPITKQEQNVESNSTDDIIKPVVTESKEVNIETEEKFSQESSKNCTEESENRKKLNNILKKVTLGGVITAASGVALFLGIVLISLIGWGDVYLFNGYDYTATLAAISMMLMLAGTLTLIATCICGVVGKYDFIKLYNTNRCKIIGGIIIVACIAFNVWGFIDYSDSQSSYSDDSSYNGSYSGSYNDYSSGLPKTSGLNVKVDRITTSGSYTYVYCSVKNVSSTYGLATRYRYVKVKAQFKNYSGQIVDTDWTYAVDSTWLEPGESKTFYFMVNNTSIKSATLSFVD